MSHMDDVKIPVEELQQKIVGKEGSQAGGVNHQAIIAANKGVHKTVSREQWLQSICSRPMVWRRSRDESQFGDVPRIPMVPEKLRSVRDFRSHYERSAVSIGPYHYHKRNSNPKLLQMEYVKDTTASRFLRLFIGYDSGTPEHVHFLNYFAEKMIRGGVREWYDKDSTKDINVEDFIRMMFLDGCFIIMFIKYFMSSSCPQELGLKKNGVSLIQQDIFKLENQLPFAVLEALCCNEWVPKASLLCLLDSYIFYCTIGSTGNFQKGFEQDQEQPLHLLDLARIRWVGKQKFEDPNSQDSTGKRDAAIHLVSNIKDITATGISLRPNSSNLLSDIHFSYFLTKKLTLPRIVIDDLKKTIFLNAVAQESCSENKFGITSYVRFLDLLIANANDVKLMRSAGVLENFLGSDEEVANFFQKLGALLELDVDPYKGVKLNIATYMATRGVIKAFRDHFSRSWTAIPVLVGYFAIFLTLLQTYFTIFPRSNH